MCEHQPHTLWTRLGALKCAACPHTWADNVPGITAAVREERVREESPTSCGGLMVLIDPSPALPPAAQQAGQGMGRARQGRGQGRAGGRAGAGQGRGQGMEQGRGQGNAGCMKGEV